MRARVKWTVFGLVTGRAPLIDLNTRAYFEVGDRADQGEAVAAVRLLHLEHGVAVVLGAEDHPEYFDRAGIGGGVGVEQGGGAHRSQS